MLKEYIQDTLHLFFPFTCAGCGALLDTHEREVCCECLNDLPYTRYWEITENPVEKMFWGKLKIVSAGSIFYFSKGGSIQGMLHALKYKGKVKVGERLGELMAEKLSDSSYMQIDMIVPVPLHREKLKKRGYNQCDPIAKALAEGIRKPVF